MKKAFFSEMSVNFKESYCGRSIKGSRIDDMKTD